MINRALIDNAKKFLNILASIEDGYYEVDKAGNLVFFNQSLQEMLGYSKEELLGMNYKRYMTNEDANKVFKTYNQVFRTGGAAKGFDWQLISKAGKKLYVETSVSPITAADGEITGFLGIIRDISERKRAEQQIRESERRLADIINFLPDATFAVDIAGKVIIWNYAAEEMTGVKAEEIIGKNNYEYAIPFYGYKKPMIIDMVREESSYVHSLFTDVERKGHTLIREVFFPSVGDSGLYCWAATAPLFDNEGNKTGAIISLRDISKRKQIENALKESLNKSQAILKSTVNALATTTEKRDLYTAGHQRRVAQLATAIAREMCFSEDMTRGIYMAATLHDIGKMQVSSDILSKPGELNYIEMLLVRTHAQVGYEIIKTIPFDLPVADMVIQHHERMDGSGYPLGLAGSKIMLEARILAVADVVEAMSSHRPYRPALGINLALEEIQRNRGTLYDPDVVDACLRLFTRGQINF
ncbi:MAG: PAS domain S-box protein, partial [Syntrophomonas sp.]|nr:PAS domain S-box protein [Syntrophomonas sp.]